MYREKVVNQWDIIVVINEGFNKVAEGNARRTSFIMVNFCPSKRISFKDWIQKLDAIVSAGDHFFISRDSLFDAMPVVWEHISGEQRGGFCALADTFSGIWTRENLKR